MFKPNYTLKLKKSSFYPDKVVCLGSQMIAILNVLEAVLPLDIIWYGADIDFTGKENFINRNQLVKIGSFSPLKKICKGVDQFLSGVLIAIKKKSNRDEYTIPVSTEDEPFRNLNIEGVLLEIRSFDTSYFEFFSEDATMIKLIKQSFDK